MKELKHTIPEKCLELIKNCPTRRHAGTIAGWLNRSHGDTPENRRAIQEAVVARKQTVLPVSDTQTAVIGMGGQVVYADRVTKQNHI